MLLKMDFRGQIYFIHLTVIFLAKVIIGQNVNVGTADFQTGKRAQIDCTFNKGIAVSALFWRFSDADVKEVPTNNVIIQYSVINNITIPPDYEGRVQLTKDYSLVINEVVNTDRSLQYWCQVNLGGVFGDDSTNVTRIDPVTPGEITENCESSECKRGDSINCTVSCFNPSDDFDIKWTVDGEPRSDTKTDITSRDGGNCFDGKSTYTIGANDVGTRNFTCKPEGRAYQYPGDYSLSKNIEIVKGTSTTSMMEKEEIMGKEEGGNNGLSDGEIAGTVIGCSICVLGIGGGLVYYVVIYKKDK